MLQAPVLDVSITTRNGNYIGILQADSNRPIDNSETHVERRKDAIRGEIAPEPSNMVRRSRIHDWWLLEVVGVLLSLGANVAIVVILAIYDGQPVPKWPYSITLNAMLSVLSTIAKTSMLGAVTQSVSQLKWLLFRDKPQKLIDFSTIDEASRGPLGALELLFRIKGRAILASAGAAIVIASLAVDPFTQQVLSYPLQSVITKDVAAPTVPRMQNWTSPIALMPDVHDTSDAFALRMKLTGGNGDSILPLPMKASIYSRLLSLGATNSTLNFSCPTGNCTFAPFTTLGFCSRCGNVTDSVTPDCNTTGEVGSGQNCSNPNIDSATLSVNCSYSLPPGDPLQLSLHADTEYFGCGAKGPTDSPNTIARVYSANMSTGIHTSLDDTPEAAAEKDPPSTKFVPPSKEFVVQGIQLPLISLGRVKSNTASPLIENVIRPNVTECALYLCFQSLNTSIRNGVITQQVLATWNNQSGLHHVDAWLDPTVNSNSPERAGNSSFYVDTFSYMSLVNYLEKLLVTQVNWTTGDTASSAFSSPITVYSSDVGQALWLADDLNGLMSSLADRMTDTLRGLSSDYATGTAYQDEVHVSVRWAWLILPIGLVLLSCGLLVATAVSSSKHDTALFKSSVLAVLFHGLSNPDDTISPLVYAKQLEAVAEHKQVQLKKDDNDKIHLVDTRQMPNPMISLHYLNLG